MMLTKVIRLQFSLERVEEQNNEILQILRGGYKPPASRDADLEASLPCTTGAELLHLDSNLSAKQLEALVSIQIIHPLSYTH